MLGLGDQVERGRARVDRRVGHDRELARARQAVDARRCPRPAASPRSRTRCRGRRSGRPRARSPSRTPAPRSACAPPVFTTSVAPAFRAAYRTAGGIEPSGCGGVHSTICAHAGDDRGHDRHADRRRVHRAAAGDVAADARERADDLAEADAVALLPPLGRELAAVEVVQARDQRVERGAELGRRLALRPDRTPRRSTMQRSRGRRRRTAGRARSGRGRPRSRTR